MWDLVGFEQCKEIRKTFVPLDAEQVRCTADAQRRKAGKRGTMFQLNIYFRELGNDPGITNAHEVSDAPFPAKP